MHKLRIIRPLAYLVILTLPCFGCVRETTGTFLPKSNSSGSVIQDGFGVNIHFTDPRSGEVKQIADAGFRWVRMDFKWDATERELGRYDFSAYDKLMAELQNSKLQALLILDYGNPLYDNGAPPRTAGTRQAFARWAVAAAKHFAGRGVIWEVYNEPNISIFWPPKPNVGEYVALALEVGRAFRAAAPDERLIGPATSQIDFDFLESCFKAGLLEYWSAVSVHPYRHSDPETAAEDYRRLRDLIKAYTPAVRNSKSKALGVGNAPDVREEVASTKNIPIISSEWGYSSVWSGMSDEKQGELLARAWLTNVANDIPLSIWYDWRDDGAKTDEAEHHFGTVAHSYVENRFPPFDPKPAYLAAKTLTAFLVGCQFEKRLAVGNAADFVLVFRKGHERRFAAWTTTSRDHEALVPLPAGTYQSTRHTGQDAGAIVADQRGLAIRLTTAPVYLQ